MKRILSLTALVLMSVTAAQAVELSCSQLNPKSSDLITEVTPRRNDQDNPKNLIIKLAKKNKLKTLVCFHRVDEVKRTYWLFVSGDPNYLNKFLREGKSTIKGFSMERVVR